MTSSASFTGKTTIQGGTLGGSSLNSLVAGAYTWSTFAGVVGASLVLDGSIATSAKFKDPTGITVDPSGNVFVADCGAHVIRKITPAGVVSTFAGLSGSNADVDGAGATAREVRDAHREPVLGVREQRRRRVVRAVRGRGGGRLRGRGQ